MLDEILPVGMFSDDGDSWVVFCPHCGRVMGLEKGPVRGEQYQDGVCGGWLEVTHDAKRVTDLREGV
jgi:hypothetical protein